MSRYGNNILEEELKNLVAKEWFAGFDTTKIIGKIDFSVAVPAPPLFNTESDYLLWAEAKQGTTHNIYESFVQLILTIGKARTYDHHLPPAFLGAFDAEKIAFIPYNAVMEVFAQNDFNWNVTPSNHDSKEFRQLLEMVQQTLADNAYLYRYDTDERELKSFIAENFKVDKKDITKVQIDKNNFTHIYQKWRKEVMPSLAVDWEEAKKEDLIDADFYLADILSENDQTIKEKLYVLLRTDRYVYNVHRRPSGSLAFNEVDFNDGQQAHRRFWKRYVRPPREEYWEYIINRRDLLVPRDVREHKGSFFTPSRWVELSQQYIAQELGDDWQDEYYVWDCCAGTGNLLAGLTNKYNLWASTLDRQDVQVMHDLIKNQSLNLLESHVFQFDFLNDPFTKLPQPLRDILNNPQKRRKLVVYINPPYAEAGNRKVIAEGGEGTNKPKTNVAVTTDVYKRYLPMIGIAGRELFAQFFIRIYKEIPSCVLAEFSTLKILQAPNFQDFRKAFQARLKQMFVVPANTFDNVNGQFPIGFFVWQMAEKEVFEQITSDVYDNKGNFWGTKNFYACDNSKSINDWMIETRKRPNESKIGYMSCRSHDFSNVNYNFIMNDKSQMKSPRGTWVTDKNIKEVTVYLAVCHCIEATWLNDRDQFLYPKDTWKEDKEFQSDCLAFTLFNNNIQMSQGVNHWIPFREEEVEAKEKFHSHFMSDYIRGKLPKPVVKEAEQMDAFAGSLPEPVAAAPIAFSAEAQAVMDAGRELWRYYHRQPGADPNAAFYDIRLHFQGTNDKGTMNPRSNDEQYTRLIGQLRTCLKLLGEKIAPKVYEHGFLIR